MKIINTNFKGLKLIKHKKFKDKRGYLKIIYNKILKIFNSYKIWSQISQFKNMSIYHV